MRDKSEWEEEPIRGVNHFMPGCLAERASALINGPYRDAMPDRLAFCHRAGILKAAGAQQVINLQGGFRDWSAASLLVESQARSTRSSDELQRQRQGAGVAVVNGSVMISTTLI